MKNKEKIGNLKCPYCGHIMEVEILKDRCLVFWKCEKCEKLIKIPEDQCCIICAFSDKKCPVHKGRTKQNLTQI